MHALLALASVSWWGCCPCSCVAFGAGETVGAVADYAVIAGSAAVAAGAAIIVVVWLCVHLGVAGSSLYLSWLGLWQATLSLSPACL